MQGFKYMEFNVFQTATGTLRKVSTDNFGNKTNVETYTVNVDPAFGFKHGFDRDGQRITGKSTVLDGLPEIDISHRQWELDYNGNTYRIEDLVPYPAIGSNKPQHYEVMLT